MNFFPVSYDTTHDIVSNTRRTQSCKWEWIRISDPEFLGFVSPWSRNTAPKISVPNSNLTIVLGSDLTFLCDLAIISSLSCQICRKCVPKKGLQCVVMVLSVILHGVESHAYHEFSH